MPFGPGADAGGEREYDLPALVHAVLHLHDVWFALLAVVLEIAAIVASRRVRLLLSAPWRQPPPLSADATPSAYRARPDDDEAPTVEDLAFMLGQRKEPVFAVLCGLVHRGIVEVDGSRIRRGEHPLPSDASVLETKLYPPEDGARLREVLAAATEHLRPYHDGRLRTWGLIVEPWAERAARFGAGIVLLAPVLLVVARFHAGGATWVTVVLLLALLGIGRLVLRPGRSTTRGHRLAREVRAVVESLALREWPDEAVDRRTVVVGVAALGPAKTVATRLMNVAVAVLGFSPGPHVLAQLRRGTGVSFDVESLVRRLSPTPVEEFAKARRIVLVAVVAVGGLATTAAWLVGDRIRPGPQGVRGFVPPTVRVDRRELVPPPERGRDVMRCTLSPSERAGAREAAAERSVFAKMAEIEQRRNPQLTVEPDFTTKREHHAAPGSIYAISPSRLYRIHVGRDGAVMADPALDLEVRLPHDDLTRLYPMAPALRSITIDGYGALMMVGDGRLYQCSPDTAMCFPRGVLPYGTQGVFARQRPDGQTLVAVDDGERWGAVEVVNPSGYLADVLTKAVADVELCVDRLSAWQPQPPPMSNPTRGFDGRLYASVYEDSKGATYLAVLDPATGAVQEHVERLAAGRVRPALLATRQGVYIFMRWGGVFRYDEERVSRIGQLGFEVVGVAAYFDPNVAPY